MIPEWNNEAIVLKLVPVGWVARCGHTVPCRNDVGSRIATKLHAIVQRSNSAFSSGFSWELLVTLRCSPIQGYCDRIVWESDLDSSDWAECWAEVEQILRSDKIRDALSEKIDSREDELRDLRVAFLALGGGES